jgi:pyrroloquinoline-quinone synthase
MTTMAHIDREIAERHLLTHPFYLAWTEGTLPRPALHEYARQYYAFETRLPRFLTALHARSEDRATRATLLSNAWDEEHGENNHAELWLRFAESLGLSRDEVTGAVPNESTQALVDCYARLADKAPVAAGVAALYAYESQLPAVADAKIKGLIEHYGFLAEEKKKGLTFFEVHRAIDVDHAAGERKVVQEAVDGAKDGQDLAVEAGAHDALVAWWDFLSAFVAA